MGRQPGNIMYLIILLIILSINIYTAGENKISFKEQGVEDFKRLCPFTDLCYSIAQRNFTVSSRFTEYPCCEWCSCEENCGNNCCPDKPKQFLNKSEVKKFQYAREQCVFAQIRPFSVSALNGKSYKMISKCPESYSDQNIAKKCLRDYHDFNFETGDFKSIMPVFSNVLNTTFKNVFCALCNNVLNVELNSWDTKVECQKRKKLSLLQTSEIMSKLSEEPFCQVMFIPSSSTPPNAVSICEGKIDRCNVTGRWKIYNPYIESACHSYSSSYEQFKNIHCFLCNGHSISEINDMCVMGHLSGGTSSFIALLDFNKLGLSSTEIGSTNTIKCSSGTRYDSYKNKCRHLSCPLGMNLLMGSCSPVYMAVDQSLHGMVFGLRFKLFPTRTSKVSLYNNLFTMEMALYDDIVSKLYVMLTSMNIPELCSYNTYIQLNSSLEETISSMHRNNLSNFQAFVSHIAVIVDINVIELKNSSATIEEMEMFFTRTTHFTHYIVQYTIDNMEMPPDSRNYTIGEEYITKLNQLNLDHFQLEMIMNGQTNNDNGYGILTFLFEPLKPTAKCEPDLLIQPNPFCPRIKLSRDEFEIDSLDRKASFIENFELPQKLMSEVTFTNMLSSDQDGSVYVCSDEYFSQLPSVAAVVDGRFDELVILTIVCLSFSIISLVFTFTVYSVLPRLRTIPGLNNMALIFHLFFAHTLALTTTITEIKPSWLCSIVGVLLHFNLLSSFFWMFISTFHMMQAFVKIKEMSFSHHKMNKFRHHVIFTELLSALLVISYIVVTITTEHDSEDFGYGGTNCYIKKSFMILYFVVIPLGLVITINLCMFSYVVWSVSRIPDMKNKSNHERHNLLIFAKLSTLTGITWLFGFLYQFTNVLLFAYFYIIFNAGQGVFIMISFVNKRTLDMLFSRVYKKTNDKTNTSKQSSKVTAISKKRNGLYI